MTRRPVTFGSAQSMIVALSAMNDGPAAEAQFKLRLVGLYECHVGNSMRYDLDLFRRYPVYSTEQLPTFLGHDDDL